MAFKKRFSRFSRRPSRRRMRADVQTLSVFTGHQIIRDPGSPQLSAITPAAEAIVLFTGGTRTESGATAESAAPLQSTGGRGVAIRGLQFDLGGFATCWLQTGSPIAGLENAALNVLHFMAIVKTKFDQVQYEYDGQVVPKWNAVPNIIASPRAASTLSLAEKAFDPTDDILWRGLEEAIAFPCNTCPPCGCTPGCTGFPFSGENCSNCGSVAGPQWMVGTVNSPDLRVYPSMTNAFKMRHVKLRTKRFLKEDDCLVLVHNWVTTQPADSVVNWETYMYGALAVRTAR